MKENRLFLMGIVLGLALVLVMSGCIKPKGEGGDDELPGTDGTDTNKPVKPPATSTTIEAKVKVKVDACQAKTTDAEIDKCIVAAAKSLRSILPCDSTVSINKDECIFQYATQSNRDTECTNISVVGKRDDCYSAIALRKSTASICAGISTTQKENDCYYQIGLKKNSTDACQSISDSKLKYQCIAKIGDKKNDVAICELIPENFIADGGNLRNSCYISTGKKLPVVCLAYAKYEDFAKCYAAIKHEDRTEGLCEIVKGEEAKAECYSDVALNEEDYLLCGKTAAEFRDSCYLDLIDANVASTDFCEIVSDPDTKDMCLIQLAGAEKEYDTCEMITQTSSRYDCYIGVAVNNADVDGCAKITNDIGRKNTCLAAIGAKTLNPEICNDITTSQLYLKCHSDIASANASAELCGNLTVEKFPTDKYKSMDICLEQYSIKTEDDSACDSISSDELKETCIDEVSIAVLCKSEDRKCPTECGFPTDSDCAECSTNADCEDGYFSTENTCAGSPKRCESQIIIECKDADNYCPGFCTETEDSDCLKTSGILAFLQYLSPTKVAYPFDGNVVSFRIKNDGILSIGKIYYKLALLDGTVKLFEKSYSTAQELKSGQLFDIENSQFLPEFGDDACQEYGYEGAGSYKISVSLSTDDFDDDKGSTTSINLTSGGNCPKCSSLSGGVLCNKNNICEGSLSNSSDTNSTFACCIGTCKIKQPTCITATISDLESCQGANYDYESCSFSSTFKTTSCTRDLANNVICYSASDSDLGADTVYATCSNGSCSNGFCN